MVDEDHPRDKFGPARGEVDDNLAAEGVADEGRGPQAVGHLPGGQGVGEHEDVQHPRGPVAVAGAGEVGRVDGTVRSQARGRRDEIAPGDAEAVDEDDGEPCGAGVRRREGVQMQAVDYGSGADEAAGGEQRNRPLLLVGAPARRPAFAGRGSGVHKLTSWGDHHTPLDY